LSHHSRMRFVLTYTGPLASNGSPKEKHLIRRALLPQLKRQWDIDPALNNIAHSGSRDTPGQGTRLGDIARRFTKAGFHFVPLVSKEFNLVCHLQITLLRNEEPGNVLQTGGDIDNRLKTLFDSLSVPAHEDQIRKLAPIAGEDPFYCLLEDDSLEIELATTLLYQHSHYSYRQIRERVSGLSAARVNEIVDLGTKHRGRHDELLRAFSAGQRLKFDILMDVGGFRDMHRHRRCVQICQDFTAAHGFDAPEDLVSAGLGPRYEKIMKTAGEASAKLASGSSEGAVHNALYVLPMGYRCRALFKMDFAEALYISELRTTPAGHFSYRNVAYAMYEKVAERYPAMAKHFRVTDVRKPVDLLQR